LLGSSRDVSWDQAAPDAATVAAMLTRARTFLPHLGSVAPERVRVGLRPQARPSLRRMFPVSVSHTGVELPFHCRSGPDLVDRCCCGSLQSTAGAAASVP
jgi:hypothetical protein